MIPLSYFSNIKNAKRSTFLGYLLGMFMAFLGVLMCILVLGGTITANLRYPLFVLSTEVDVGIIVQRIEGVVVAVWLTTNFISTFFFIYLGVKGMSQILKLTDYRKIVIPIGLIIAVFSQFIYKSVPYQIRWDTETWPALAFTEGFFIPVVLLLVSVIRKMLAKSKA
nr:GerAB/ArcD/ProY family transporter [Ruminiclostridium papyrosolvens]